MSGLSKDGIPPLVEEEEEKNLPLLYLNLDLLFTGCLFYDLCHI